MPRKSPRSRRRVAQRSRLPKSRRSRATPRRARPARRTDASSRRGTRALKTASIRHAPKGARAATARDAGPARRKTPGANRALERSTRRSRFRPPDPERVRAILDLLQRLYPEATTALHHENALQLLIATILSAQCTDERVNRVTPALFARYPNARAFAEANRAELEEMIRPTGFFRNKAKAIQACCADIVSLHGGDVPEDLDALTALHGVGRKTANVVLGNAFGVPGLVVDTHVGRVSRRLGLARELDPIKVERELMQIVPREDWTRFSHWLILHGRRICVARKPRCSICPLLPHCPRLGAIVSQ